MSSPTDLEDRLSALFDSQARSLHVPEREWSEVGGMPRQPSRRPGRSLALGLAAAVPLVLALVLASAKGPSQVTTDAGPASAGAPAAFKVETRQVVMAADAVSIDVGGKRFVTAQPLQAHSDPGSAEYTTLELSWQEHGVEMRMNVYFIADGREWGSKEIRTYDGNAQGEWITYEGDFFRSPLGSAFTGDLDVTGSNERGTGRLRLSNLRLEAFRRPAGCAKATSPYVLAPATDPITISTNDGTTGYSTAVQLLETASCAPVADPARFAYEWTAEDPTIVAVNASGPRADLQPKAAGTTNLQVTARDGRTGEVAGKASIEVVVRSRADGGAAGRQARPGPAQP